jgi:hypothetical protein
VNQGQKIREECDTAIPVTKFFVRVLSACLSLWRSRDARPASGSGSS